MGYRQSWGPRSWVGAALDLLVKIGTELSALRGACGWQGGQGCLWFTSAPQCLRQGGGAAGRSDWLPGLFPRLAPSHACLFALPREEVAGQRGGGTPQLLLGSHLKPFLQGELLDLGGGCTLQTRLQGLGELHTARLPRRLPAAPKQRRLRLPLPAEGWEAVVLSHPGLCHFSETSTTPPILAPGESSALARLQRRDPVCTGCRMHPLPPPPTRSEGLCWGCIEVLQDPSLRTIRAPSSCEASPSASAPAPPRTDKYLS